MKRFVRDSIVQLSLNTGMLDESFQFERLLNIHADGDISRAFPGGNKLSIKV